MVEKFEKYKLKDCPSAFGYFVLMVPLRLRVFLLIDYPAKEQYHNKQILLKTGCNVGFFRDV
ncbi:hypothetical protein DN752_15775 [Echinicola strongylocentroti]|uniref:Uncharacterized protein n=1 Tax=Echinicola strongylocentroti TaxID=1795355 RepID=A0A2Z4IKG9_9BACT|nr:hypothetical protein DN752_15775 [Echinicola strongylocentroti]